MSIRFKTVAAIFASVLMIPSVYAANGNWTTVASTCVPDEESQDIHMFRDASFEFQPGDFGQIIARCNITDPHDTGNFVSPPWAAMDVTYNDPDGMAAGNRVRVLLRRAHEVTGVGPVLAVFDSNLFGAGQQLQSLAFAHAFNFTNFAYYIVIIVDRANAIMDPRIQRIRLR